MVMIADCGVTITLLDAIEGVLLFAAILACNPVTLALVACSIACVIVRKTVHPISWWWAGGFAIAAVLSVVAIVVFMACCWGGPG
jgi:hypothetical protein